MRRRDVRVAVALGSNLGDRAGWLAFGLRQLDALLVDLIASTPIETDPVGVPDGPRFLNAAVVGFTDVPPRELLEGLLAIETHAGRRRPFPGAPRTLDLDLVLYGDRIIHEPGLEVPHPRFREREFVLRPLAEIAPDFRDPVTKRTVRELRDALVARR